MHQRALAISRDLGDRAGARAPISSTWGMLSHWRSAIMLPRSTALSRRSRTFRPPTIGWARQSALARQPGAAYRLLGDHESGAGLLCRGAPVQPGDRPAPGRGLRAQHNPWPGAAAISLVAWSRHARRSSRPARCGPSSASKITCWRARLALRWLA